MNFNRPKLQTSRRTVKKLIITPKIRYIALGLAIVIFIAFVITSGKTKQTVTAQGSNDPQTSFSVSHRATTLPSTNPSSAVAAVDTNPQLPTPSPAGTTPKDILTKLESELKVEAPIYAPNPGGIDWQTTEGNYIPLSGVVFSLGISKADLVGQYRDYKKTNAITTKVLEELLNSSKQVVLTDGFTQSSLNSAKNSGGVSIKAGFEKGSTYCVMLFYEKANPFVHYFCGEYNKQQDEYRKNIAKLYPYNDADQLVWVDAMLNDRAIVSLGHRQKSGGSYTIIVREKDDWKEIFRGQANNPSCKLMEKYNVPKEVYEFCDQ